MNSKWQSQSPWIFLWSSERQLCPGHRDYWLLKLVAISRSKKKERISVYLKRFSFKEYSSWFLTRILLQWYWVRISLCTIIHLIVHSKILGSFVKSTWNWSGRLIPLIWIKKLLWQIVDLSLNLLTVTWQREKIG